MLRLLVRVIAPLLLLLASVWAPGVVVFAGPFPATAAKAVAIALTLVAVAGMTGLFATRLRPALYVLAAALVATVLWRSTIRPSNDRQWQQ